jgi:catechol 2,3-dioxygenase-like lactoylglutathione lyase family enzyme
MIGVTPALVLYARDLAETRRFYETLGLGFVEERHGDGPVHYACDFQGMVLELYPGVRSADPPKPCGNMALVLFTGEFDKVLVETIAIGRKATSVGMYIKSLGLRAASFRDPDGRLVRLLERDPRDVQ